MPRCILYKRQEKLIKQKFETKPPPENELDQNATRPPSRRRMFANKKKLLCIKYCNHLDI